MKPKKVPLRMCVGCREMKPKRELLRIVKSPEEVISFDKTGKAHGRGAYICANSECLAKSIKNRGLERGLEHKISQEIFEQLEYELGRRELLGGGH